MLGKNKCKILKEIRRQIASENDIPFVTEECRYQGNCKGTCPKCESELRYLEEQLEKRRALGKKVTVSAMAVGLLASAAGCRPIQTVGIAEDPQEITELDGEIASWTEPETEDTAAAPSCDGTDEQPEDETYTLPEEYELLGDVAFAPENAPAPEG